METISLHDILSLNCKFLTMNQCSFVLFYYCSQPRVGHGDKYLPGYLHAAEAPTVSAKMPVVAVYALCGSTRTGKLDRINFVSMDYFFIVLNCVLAFAHTPHHSLSKHIVQVPLPEHAGTGAKLWLLQGLPSLSLSNLVMIDISAVMFHQCKFPLLCLILQLSEGRRLVPCLFRESTMTYTSAPDL